uniref:Uncharacterized protein n=1 Tax=Picea glauca TaxID=3330 RepID=A0A117NHD0_PICGL|nr:hypothetical protein ABT39_MTgene5151 [Picea glauca]QHR90851.1 hypothetical protein Q903MT_gene4878 [Picea sitchensis]
MISCMSGNSFHPFILIHPISRLSKRVLLLLLLLQLRIRKQVLWKPVCLPPTRPTAPPFIVSPSTL